MNYKKRLALIMGCGVIVICGVIAGVMVKRNAESEIIQYSLDDIQNVNIIDADKEDMYYSYMEKTMAENITGIDGIVDCEMHINYSDGEVDSVDVSIVTETDENNFSETDILTYISKALEISVEDISLSFSKNNHEMANEKTDIYNHVIEEYRDMVQNDFYEDLLDSDTYDSSFGEHIGLEIRTHKRAVFYAFYDIDGNGTKELIIAGGEDGIGVSNPAFSPCNYDIYGYDGTNVIHLFPEMEFGYRTNFSLYENGIIEVYYSNSAAESGVDFYRIGSDGSTPELVDSFSTVWHLEEEESVCTYFQKENEISEEEYKTNMQDYEVTLSAGLDWIEIY